MSGELPDDLGGHREICDHGAQVCLPIQMAINQFHERQLYEADLALERQRIQQRMAALEGEEYAVVC